MSDSQKPPSTPCCDSPHLRLHRPTCQKHPPPDECGCGGRHVQGRACTSAKKRETLTLLLALWERRPHQRLGQLLYNAYDLYGHKDPFYLEDDALVDLVDDRFRPTGTPGRLSTRAPRSNLLEHSEDLASAPWHKPVLEGPPTMSAPSQTWLRETAARFYYKHLSGVMRDWIDGSVDHDGAGVDPDVVDLSKLLETVYEKGFMDGMKSDR